LPNATPGILQAKKTVPFIRSSAGIFVRVGRIGDELCVQRLASGRLLKVKNEFL
jgi:hypothetical protein